MVGVSLESEYSYLSFSPLEGKRGILMDKRDKVLGGLVGLCVGDALGVPVEFKSRSYLKRNPVRDMIGYGAHNQPPGTWSDDSSLALCLAESLCHGFDLKDVAEKFVKWLFEGYWTPHGVVFDVGRTTRKAIKRLRDGVEPLKAGLDGEYSNGNGSLMRILPLAFYVEKLEPECQFELAHEVSCLTHRHPRSQMACGIYVQFAVQLLKGKAPCEAYSKTREIALEYYKKEPFCHELPRFSRILEGNIAGIDEDGIKSSGYVIDTLEASLWCLLTSNTFSEAVLKAVNLGCDSDTTGAVTGGIAGIYYGFRNIPNNWVEALARKEDILELAVKFFESIYGVRGCPG